MPALPTDPPTASIRFGGHPLLHFLCAFPIAGFCGAVVTDITYARTADFLWANASAWLLAAAEIIAVPAALAGLVALATTPSRARPRALPVALGAALILALGLLNNLVHSRDGWTAVVPAGLILSILTALLVLVTLWAATAPVIVRAEPTVLVTGPRP
jgi:uncharacterized membrane protein